MGGNGDYEWQQRRGEVETPPPKPFYDVVKSTVKETLFPDDPFRQFKNQPLPRKFVLGLQYFVPILEWAPRYTFQSFKADVIAGITIASLAVPQGISYAGLANLPAVIGLCKNPRHPQFTNNIHAHMHVVNVTNFFYCCCSVVNLVTDESVGIYVFSCTMQIRASCRRWCTPCSEVQKIWRSARWLSRRFSWRRW